jgi:hypothetical protein
MNISFKLRPGKDGDLIKALEGIAPGVDRSTVYRAALRYFFKHSPGSVQLLNKKADADSADRSKG